MVTSTKSFECERKLKQARRRVKTRNRASHNKAVTELFGYERFVVTSAEGSAYLPTTKQGVT